MCVKVLDAQPCPTLCNPMDCSPPGSSVHGTLQERIQEWVVISFSWICVCVCVYRNTQTRICMHICIFVNIFKQNVRTHYAS